MISVVKKIFYRHGILYHFVKAIYNYWIPPEIAIEEILAQFDSKKKTINFIQVGSNDGISGDPIYRFITQGKSNWNGLLIEPVPYLFKKLETTYRNHHNRLIFENVAIDHFDGIKTLYRIEGLVDSAKTPWYEQIGSFNKAILEKHKQHIENFDQRIVEEPVRTLTFSHLLNRHKIQKVDLIHIDTEGYDFEIIKMIDLDNLHPEILLFEHKHLSRADYRNCCRLLRKHKFQLYAHSGDTIAINFESRILLNSLPG